MIASMIAVDKPFDGQQQVFQLKPVPFGLFVSVL